MAIVLFTLFFYDSFNVMDQWWCHHLHFWYQQFVIFFFFWFAWLEIYQWSFRRTSFWFRWFSLLLSYFQCHWFPLWFLWFPLLGLVLNCPSNSSSLRWKHKFILDLSSFLTHTVNATDFPLSTAFTASCKFWSFLFLFSFSPKYFLKFLPTLLLRSMC